MGDWRQEETRSLGTRTIAALEQHGLQPTPEAYKVWFSFLADANPDLTRLMRTALDRGEPFDDARCQELFERFFASVKEERQLQRAGLRLGELAHQLMHEVGGISEGTARYGTALSQARDGVARSSSSEEVGRLLSSIVGETGRMQEHVQRLEALLLESSTRIEDLRRDLQLAWREARTDGLTGLANRKHFDLAIRTAAAQALEQDVPVCLLMADVDHFKTFNDEHGHVMGDHVLRLVASILRGNVKGKDLLARYGGEEFALILPATQLHDAATLANQLRESVAARHVQLKQSGQSLGRVTMSFGVTAYVANEPVGDWISRADEALYQAKRAGRNRVISLPVAAAQPGRAPAQAAMLRVVSG
jgi:diguanylate cyclase